MEEYLDTIKERKRIMNDTDRISNRFFRTRVVCEALGLNALGLNALGLNALGLNALGLQSMVLVTAGWLVLLCSGCGQPQSTSPGADLTFYGQVRLGTDPSNEELGLDFVVRGDRIFLDRDRNQQMDPEELVDSSEEIEVMDARNQIRYRIRNMRLARAVSLVSEQEPQRLGLTVTSDQFPGFEQLGNLPLSLRPQPSAAIEFFGRQEFVFDDYQDGLMIGGESEIRVNLGTVARKSAALKDDEVLEEKGLNQTRLAILLPSPSGPFPQVEIVFSNGEEQQLLKKTLDKAC
jgi:hypothetical protein